MLHVLVADDEPPALEELAFLLRRDSRVEQVHAVGSGAEALKALDAERVDAMFLDIRMPGLDGLDVARLLMKFSAPPAVVFVTAYEDHAVHAFDLGAVDYLLKPVRPERVAEAVRRVAERLQPAAPPAPADPAEDESIAVELGGVVRFVTRSQVRFVEAHGDYARLHTAGGTHLVRVSLATLEAQWAEAGFVRIHRSYLVAARHIDEVRVDGGRVSVLLGDDVLQVSRRHRRELRDLLVRRARPAALRDGTT